MAAAATTTPAAATAAAAPSCYPYLIPLPPSLPSDASADTALLIPPLSFNLVCPGVYRSACPTQRNLPFLSTLGLRSVVYLCSEEYPASTLAAFTAAGVSVRCFAIEGNQEPFKSVDEQLLQQALLYALDARHQPVLVHCSKGKHRTGCFVGVLRRLGGHSLSSIFAEYRQFLGATFVARDLDRLVIETHDILSLKRKLKEQVPEEHRPDWIEIL